MIIVKAPQRSPEWFQARAGKLTGSCAGAILATTKAGAEAATRRDLRLRLALERLTGESQEDAFQSKEMQRGLEKEPDAFAAYEAMTGNAALQVGFIAHDELLAGCSPDGEVDGYEGIIELKCPKSFTHLSYLRSGEIPRDYRAQMTHNLWITGAKWCDFMSFDDRFPPSLQLFYRRLMRDEKEIAAYDLMARLFLGEVEAELAAVRRLAEERAA